MTDEPKRKNPIGATGKTVADNVKRLREGQRLAFVDLAATLESIGKPIPTLGLRHIEAYKRRVDTDDLVALAVALDVSPVTLLMPNSDGPGAEVPVTGVLSRPVQTGRFWDWLIGVYPLEEQSEDQRGVTSQIFQRKARPAWAVSAAFGSVRELPAGIDMKVVNKVAQNAATKAVDDLLKRYEQRHNDGDD
ncbi:hypothetical protein [Mycolicibacterium austroafricanum]|uniref:hypothetical protein n=1 Tax=Mycolicibacterium austroafricanum TaxID=39687 RepID=UPI001CA32C20|nr:hypothetical protein [Mycolicibacterium austroafricanum]QZT56734.1 hypothetical protein JN084_28220 [Mycolicibacterium austroafricanum]